MNRGSLEKRTAHPVRNAGFNEAPIHESGKSASSLPTARPGPRFNEAPIHESGKSAG